MTWATVNGTTINNNGTSRFITGSNTANTLEGHSNFTYDGNRVFMLGNHDEKITLGGSDHPKIQFRQQSSDRCIIQWENNEACLRILNQNDNSQLRIKDDLQFSTDSSSYYSILHQNNVGSGGKLASTNVYVNQIHGAGNFTTINTTGTFTEDENHLANNTPVINCSLGNYFTIDISSNCTFSFTNEPANTVAYGCVVEVVHSGGTISWPSELKWSTDGAPALTTGKTHLFFFTTNDGGSRWRGAYQVDYTN